MLEKHPLIRTIYLYLFSLIGLALVVIGVARFVELGLKTYVFTKADDVEYVYRPEIPLPAEPGAEQPAKQRAETKVKAIQSCTDVCQLSEEDKADVSQWLDDYRQWKEQVAAEAKIDRKGAARQRTAASALAQIIVGLPLYAYHWMVIKRDRREG